MKKKFLALIVLSGLIITTLFFVQEGLFADLLRVGNIDVEVTAFGNDQELQIKPGQAKGDYQVEIQRGNIILMASLSSDAADQKTEQEIFWFVEGILPTGVSMMNQDQPDLLELQIKDDAPVNQIRSGLTVISGPDSHTAYINLNIIATPKKSEKTDTLKTLSENLKTTSVYTDQTDILSLPEEKKEEDPKEDQKKAEEKLLLNTDLPTFKEAIKTPPAKPDSTADVFKRVPRKLDPLTDLKGDTITLSPTKDPLIFSADNTAKTKDGTPVLTTKVKTSKVLISSKPTVSDSTPLLKVPTIPDVTTPIKKTEIQKEVPAEKTPKVTFSVPATPSVKENKTPVVKLPVVPVSDLGYFSAPVPDTSKPTIVNNPAAPIADSTASNANSNTTITTNPTSLSPGTIASFSSTPVIDTSSTTSTLPGIVSSIPVVPTTPDVTTPATTPIPVIDLTPDTSTPAADTCTCPLPGILPGTHTNTHTDTTTHTFDSSAIRQRCPVIEQSCDVTNFAPTQEGNELTVEINSQQVNLSEVTSVTVRDLNTSLQRTYRLSILHQAAEECEPFDDQDQLTPEESVAVDFVHCTLELFTGNQKDNRFYGDRDLIRAELATILYRGEGAPEVTDEMLKRALQIFHDINRKNIHLWFAGPVAYNSFYDLMVGYGEGDPRHGSFGIEEPLLLIEAAEVIPRITSKVITREERKVLQRIVSQQRKGVKPWYEETENIFYEVTGQRYLPQASETVLGQQRIARVRFSVMLHDFIMGLKQ